MSSIILGIDPGSLRTGFGVLRAKGDQLEYLDHGVIALRAEATLSSRLATLYAELTKLFLHVKPQVTVIESVFLGRNPDSVFKLGHARGVAMALASHYKTEVAEYAPRYVKKAVTGSGAASKEQVQMLVLNLLRIENREPKIFDATDALALAICHARVFEVSVRMKRLMESAR